MIGAEAAHAIDQHEEASRRIWAYLDHGEPFALLLRSFELESYVGLGKGLVGSEPQRVAVLLEDEGSVTRDLVDGVQAVVPVIGIANTGPASMNFKHHFPKLGAGNETWREVLEELVRAAAFIVVNVSSMSVGITSELEVIGRVGRAADTVIVLSEAESANEARRLFRVEKPAASVPEREALHEAGFPCVVDAEEIKSGELDAVPAFKELFARTKALQALEERQRMSWDGVRF
jgi:hypothetical protein